MFTIRVLGLIQASSDLVESIGAADEAVLNKVLSGVQNPFRMNDNASGPRNIHSSERVISCRLDFQLYYV